MKKKEFNTILYSMQSSVNTVNEDNLLVLKNTCSFHFFSLGIEYFDIM